LPKVADLIVTALSGQDVAKSHDNDVFVFDSSSAILEMERREDEPKSTAHEQRFFRRAESFSTGYQEGNIIDNHS